MSKTIFTFLSASLAGFSDISLAIQDDGDQCQIVFPQRLPILVSLAEGLVSTWLLSTVISPMPAADCQRWLTDLLAANCRLLATDGATLGLDVEHDTIVLARQLEPTTKSPDELYQLLMSFAYVADHWRRRLAISFLPENFFDSPSTTDFRV